MSNKRLHPSPNPHRLGLPVIEGEGDTILTRKGRIGPLKTHYVLNGRVFYLEKITKPGMCYIVDSVTLHD